ncbi:MAG: GH32 C-terminal domain-containing protein [Planctomycetales bacterium]|nr:GH32 C-terminal domain-containing protein [Planctomycetales bacterium]
MRLGDTVAPFELQAGEDLELRVFVDRNVIEVFANERQAVVASHPYARKNVAVSLFSEGGDVQVTDVRCCKMNSIYTR